MLIPVDKADKFRQALSVLPDSERVVWIRHKIKSGETLSTIAERYKTTVAHIKKVNHIESNLILAGRDLMIPRSSKGILHYVHGASQRSENVPSHGSSGIRRIHQVRRGDTLWRLAKIYNSSVDKIAQWNKISPRTLLKLGQKLVIWPSSQRVAAIGDAANFNSAIQTVRYTVKPGDSLGGIASRFNIKVTDLFRWNDKLRNTKYIHPGQEIRLQLDVREQSG